ncbi:zinc finger protein, partial [Aphelenchoides avenae]
MDNRFSCGKCPKSFGRRFDLLRHLRTIHKLQRFHCAKCPKSYAHKCHLNDHVRLVHAKRQAPQGAGSSKSVGFKGQSTVDAALAQGCSRPLVCTICKE